MNDNFWLEMFMALASLTALELVLGIDNLIFISLLAGRLPTHQQARARRYGLAAALFMRLALLMCLKWLSELTRPILDIGMLSLSGRDLVLLLGGLFLLAKTVHEIHQMLETPTPAERASGRVVSFGSVILQIALLDLVFSLDSVITAVGMVEQIGLMVAAILLSMGAMVWIAEPMSQFVARHPSLKMLALSFLMLIGTLLLAEGLGHHIPKNYVYFAMAFSLAVEILNIKARARM